MIFFWLMNPVMYFWLSATGMAESEPTAIGELLRSTWADHSLPRPPSHGESFSLNASRS